MQPLPVVKHLDVLEHLAANFVAIGKAFVVREFLLERSEELSIIALSYGMPFRLMLATRPAACTCC